jgi:hypothetical protein
VVLRLFTDHAGPAAAESPGIVENVAIIRGSRLHEFPASDGSDFIESIP